MPAIPNRLAATATLLAAAAAFAGLALTGAGVIGGFLLIALALAADQIAVPVVVAIGGLSVASSILATDALVRSQSVTGLARTVPAPIEG